MENNQVMQEQLIGEGVGFERIRRITGYLVGTLDRFNNGKRAEEHDRVKHSVTPAARWRRSILRKWKAPFASRERSGSLL